MSRSLLILLMLFSLTLLAACGGGADSGDDATDEDASAETADDTAEETTDSDADPLLFRMQGRSFLFDAIEGWTSNFGGASLANRRVTVESNAIVPIEDGSTAEDVIDAESAVPLAELEVSEVNGITFYTNTMLDIPRVFFEYNGEIIEINVISVGSGITDEQQAQNLSDALDLLSTIREEG
ncbi:MAG: hypothetical protein AAFQ07_18810 [Chloroflexota bacterium]